ncbi:MAG: FtsQ-type POTRA domain-containing protein [Pseudomonadota bacterium]
MRRLSPTDIVVTPDDRLPGGNARRAKGEPRADARAASDPKPKKAKRKAPRLRFELTPLQKLASGGVAVTALVIGAAALWHSGAPQRTARTAVDSVFAATARAGFRIEEITIKGRARTSTEQIVQALGARHGDPILALDIATVKDRLESIPSVKEAAVERRLPGSLHLAIVEREPVALWQNEGEFVLVDRDGHQIPGSIAGHEHLPVVVGQGAPAAAEELLTVMATEPHLGARVKAAVRVAGRRWNLRLDHAETGLEVRMPENDLEAAWHRLAELEREHALSGRQITMLDMRVPDRLVMRTDRDGKRKDNGV